MGGIDPARRAEVGFRARGKEGASTSLWALRVGEGVAVLRLGPWIPILAARVVKCPVMQRGSSYPFGQGAHRQNERVDLEPVALGPACFTIPGKIRLEPS